MQKGSCNCGGVAFQIAEPLQPPSVCHCGQCRKQSGHVWASAVTHQADLRLTAQDSLRWYSASDTARRGFCGTCGAFLFWQHNDEDTISVAMGALEAPTELRLARHIFVADKGDYYDITDELPQNAQ
ncbi:GFA family protein [Sedimentitalea nanhaiensis]|uniref:Uncharacterized conserved protein n=1 Tax=Sedimentitalea nanhaiensis TaxID=999627 RepID=A0A1I7BZJ6_9RHOB|nr:GFA family protein [Sedimentitalea nanhaiensis]SFT92596.1 Uncharacterized conserved protein [Sedimentitalea nanhaiensis]